MPDLKISQLTAVVSPATTDVVPIVNAGATKKVTIADLIVAAGAAPLASPTFTGTVTLPTPFTLGAVSVLPTGTELNFVDGVTSAIQTQLDTKLATNGAGTSLTGIPYTITGTANQVVASAGTGNITLSLPQSIATSSTPQFARIGLGAAANATALIVGSGHLNLSASPTNTWTLFNAMLVGGTGTIFGITGRAAGNETHIGNNTYYNSGHKAIVTDLASEIMFYNGTINLRTAVSVSADAAQTWLSGVLITTTGVTLSSLGGSGSRSVLADATGLLSAPVSDARLKTNVRPISSEIDILDRLDSLNGVYFDFIPTDGVALTQDKRPQVGMLAQEVEKVFPEMVGFNAPVNGVAYRYLNYEKIGVFNLEVEKALKARLILAEDRITALEKKLRSKERQ